MIDRITIFEIKSVEIPTEAAGAATTTELRLLQDLAKSIEASEPLSDLISSLKAVNFALWKIEDAILARRLVQAKLSEANAASNTVASTPTNFPSGRRLPFAGNL